jgi:hypothetical protein
MALRTLDIKAVEPGLELWRRRMSYSLYVFGSFDMFGVQGAEGPAVRRRRMGCPQKIPFIRLVYRPERGTGG